MLVFEQLGLNPDKDKLIVSAFGEMKNHQPGVGNRHHRRERSSLETLPLNSGAPGTTF